MSNELTSRLSTIASVSASFVAILGGFVASKLITINGERAAVKSQLTEIHFEKMLRTEERDILSRQLDEEDAICYIHDHMDALANNMTLDQVYEEAELQLIDYETLLPYWERARYFKGLFEKYLQSPDCKFNSDMIPVELAEENTDDLFIYELLKMYAGWGFSDYFENCESMSRRPWCESTKQHLLQLNMQVSALEIQEHRYELDQKRLISPRGMKSGLVLCLLFSFFNIIFPLSLSIFSFSNKVIPFIQASSILLLAIGLVTTFGYFAKMLTWK